MVEFIFDCPYCREPFSRVVGNEVDIHSGATYLCASCSEGVTFQAMTAEDYVAYCKWEHDRHMEAANAIK